MVYGTLAQARKYAGNPSTTNVPDSDITTALEGGDALINTLTNRTWVISDAEYPLIQRISELLASSLIRTRSSDPDKISDEQKSEALDYIKMINENKKDSTSGAITIRNLGYRTNPLNPQQGIKTSRGRLTGLLAADFEDPYHYY